MPIYNEAATIESSLAAIMAQDYPPSLVEILIADSRSNDGTLERIQKAIQDNPTRRIRVLPDIGQTPGAALNAMIREAIGEILIRVDGHAEVAHDYVRQCVNALQSTDALNVGGYISATGEGFIASAIATAVGSFWGNGGARFRNPPVSQPIYTDTVPFGAWRRETFARVGLFVEEWRANEDCEFNSRILDAGGRILLHPGIKARYFSRGSVRSLADQYFRYGRLKSRVVARHPRRLRMRQVIPPLLVLALLAPLVGWAFGFTTLWPFVIAAVGYLLALEVASVQMAVRGRQPGFILVLPSILATLHLTYGTGALVGAAELAMSYLLSSAALLVSRTARRVWLRLEIGVWSKL